MDLTILFFLTSGLFLGWSLGANDAANVFGTAVGTRMVRFGTAALVCSVFVVLGATFSGAGAAHTLGKLGSVNALGGSFVAALSAALTVYWMTKLRLPVSTSQAIVGAIIGWNFFSNSITDIASLIKILTTWVACPVLAGLIAVPLFKLTDLALKKAKFHLLSLDAITRVGLVVAGAFGSYALGANNIANVMGVFVPVSPFTDIELGSFLQFSGVQQLFFIGAVAIAVGVFTYSKRVMLTVGGNLMQLSPVAAWVVVVSHSIVLFLFASEGLEHLLASYGLPTIPLVPVSSSQAVVGAVVGLGLMKGGKNIQWDVLGKISAGWVTTPIISAAVCFVALFFLQNIFNQTVYNPVHYKLSPVVVERLVEFGISVEDFRDMDNKDYTTAIEFRNQLRGETYLTGSQEKTVLQYAELTHIRFDEEGLAKLPDDGWLSDEQVQALYGLKGKRYQYEWRVAEVLASASPEWGFKPTTMVNKSYNKLISQKLDYVYHQFEDKPR